MEKLNKKTEADEIFDYISSIEIEYFSNMHLKELPYYQAKSFEHMNEPLKAQHIITKFVRECDQIKDIKDNGFFGTTPFFISFVDSPERMRVAHYLYLMALCDDAMGNSEKFVAKMKESLRLNNDNMFANYFVKFSALP